MLFNIGTNEQTIRRMMNDLSQVRFFVVNNAKKPDIANMGRYIEMEAQRVS